MTQPLFTLDIAHAPLCCAITSEPLFVLSCTQSDAVSLTGPARNCEEAKRALERKVVQLEAEKEERVSVLPGSWLASRLASRDSVCLLCAIL